MTVGARVTGEVGEKELRSNLGLETDGAKIKSYIQIGSSSSEGKSSNRAEEDSTEDSTAVNWEEVSVDGNSEDVTEVNWQEVSVDGDSEKQGAGPYSSLAPTRTEFGGKAFPQ